MTPGAITVPGGSWRSCLRGGVLPGGMLGREGGLDAVEEALQPANQLGLGDPQLRVRRRSVRGEGQGDPFQLLDQCRRETVLQFLDGAFMDSGQPCPRRVVERGGFHFVQELLHHGADPHHLRGFVHEILELAGLGAGPSGRRGLAGLSLSGLQRLVPGRFSVVAGRPGVQGGALDGGIIGGLSVVRIAHGFILS